MCEPVIVIADNIAYNLGQVHTVIYIAGESEPDGIEKNTHAETSLRIVFNDHCEKMVYGENARALWDMIKRLAAVNLHKGQAEWDDHVRG